MAYAGPNGERPPDTCTFPIALFTVNERLSVTGYNPSAVELFRRMGSFDGAADLAQISPRLSSYLATFLENCSNGRQQKEFSFTTVNLETTKVQVWLARLHSGHEHKYLCALSEVLDSSCFSIEKKILDSVEIVAVAVNGRGEVVYFSPSIERVLGYHITEVLGDGWWTVSSLDGRPREEAREKYARYARGEVEVTNVREIEYRHKDGTPRWMLWNFAKGPDDLLVGVGQDITSRNIERSELHERTSQLTALIESSPLGIVITNEEGLVTSCNPAFERMFGYAQQEISGNPQRDLIVPPNELDRSMRMSDALREQRSSTQLAQRRTKAGQIKDVQIHAVPLMIDGRSLGSYYLYEDITERRKARRELEEIERRMELFFSNSLAGAFYSELQEPVSWQDFGEHEELLEHIMQSERVRKANPALLKLFEVQAMAVIGHSSREFLDAPLLPSRELWRELFDSGRLQVEVEQVTKSGTRLWLSEEFLCVYDALGNIQGFFGVLRDLTDRVRATKSLVNSERQLRAVFESSSDAMAVLDNSRKICDANPAFASLVQSNPQHTCTGKIDGIVVNIQDLHTYWIEMLTRGMVQGTLQIKRSDAKVREVEFSGRANFLPGRHLWTCRDVTEKRLLEQELHQAQKMEAIGRLAGGVAHDFNNMLTVIRGYADLLLRKLPEEDPNRRYATGILQAADRSAMTTQQLLAFSKRRAPQGCCLNLNEVVSEMGKLIQRLIGEDVQLQFDLATGLKPVWGDPGQMGQVVLNLAINSRDAMPRGGVLKIRTSDLKIPDLEALKGKLKPGNYIRLDVSDTGTGMTEEVKQRIFEPFFTTKETGKGTGLGLSTVYAIVNSSGGSIDVASELGKGTHFTICFPAAELGQRPVC